MKKSQSFWNNEFDKRITLCNLDIMINKARKTRLKNIEVMFQCYTKLKGNETRLDYQTFQIKFLYYIICMLYGLCGVNTK